MANFVQNYKSRLNVVWMPWYKDSFSVHTSLWSTRWFITCYPVFQLRSWMLMHTNVQKSMPGVGPAGSCILSSSHLNNSQLLAAGRAAFQNQWPKYSELIWENGEVWSMACPTFPLAVDAVPKTTARMCLDERDRKQDECPRREESVVLFKVPSHIIPHSILTSFCVPSGKV